MKLIPPSSARWMIRIDSSWSVSPQAPNIIAPRHSGLTWTPVRPNVRCSMSGKLLRQDHRDLDLAVGDVPVGPQQAGGVLARHELEAVALVEADRPVRGRPGPDEDPPGPR